jgi:uncharacterized protein DUF5947
MTQAPITALRKFVRPHESPERCDSCGVSLSVDHIHQFDPATRRIRCACQACAALNGTTYRDIPRRVLPLPNFRISDAQWDDLMIPISLAFFSFQTPLNRIVALYPGPAGAAESSLPLDTWKNIARANPALQEMERDVEALLVNRVGQTRDYFIVPIDDCYKLVGLIRLHWHGLSGGALVWGEIKRFFEDLHRRGGACQA